MKILLLNDNPVVTKLVTLSAQKTSDTLEVVDNVDAIEGSSYDLLVVDDTLYSTEAMSALNEKITFSKSLYICSRDAESVDTFTSTLKKPFLPTDLVELFASFGENISKVEEVNIESDAESDEVSELDELEEISLENDSDEADKEPEELEDISLDEDIDELDDDLELEDLEEVELDEELDLDDVELEEELNLDDLDKEVDLESDAKSDEDSELDELEGLSLEDDSEESVLDKDDLQEVQDLLDEVNIESDAVSDEVSELDELEDLSLESDSNEVDKELELDEIEEQIQEAEESLTEEDLAQEVDEEILTDIADLDSLTSTDLKLAIGEPVEVDAESDAEFSEVSEVNPESDAESSEVSEVNELEELSLESDSSKTADNDGVEALKKLLKALTDNDVAASMNGMKININITLGDN